MMQKSILVIEDDLSLLEIYSNIASDIFHNVHQAKNLKEAEQIILNEAIDGILTDNALPDGQGIEFLSDNRNIIRQLPTILMSAYTDKRLAIAATNIHVWQILEKPIGVKDLQLVLNEFSQHIDEQQRNQCLINRYDICLATQKMLKSLYSISERELDIIARAMHPDDTAQIATQLHISRGTVRRHLENIFKKMQISSRNELRETVTKLNCRNNVTHALRKDRPQPAA